MELETENIRLNEANVMLMRENEYLRALLDRFIPIPVNENIESLQNRLRKIEEKM